MSELLTYSLAAQPAVSASPAWYETATGILAIPAAIIGLVIAYYTVTKMRLDIDEKRRARHEAVTAPSPTSSNTPSPPPLPVVNSEVVQDIILRFIVLFIALSVWNVLGRLFTFLAQSPAALTLFNIDWVTVVAYGLSLAIGAVPSIGSALIVLALGAPLSYDLARHFNFDLSPRLGFLQSPRRSVFVTVGLLALVLDAGSNIFSTG